MFRILAHGDDVVVVVVVRSSSRTERAPQCHVRSSTESGMVVSHISIWLHGSWRHRVDGAAPCKDGRMAWVSFSVLEGGPRCRRPQRGLLITRRRRTRRGHRHAEESGHEVLVVALFTAHVVHVNKPPDSIVTVGQCSAKSPHFHSQILRLPEAL